MEERIEKIESKLDLIIELLCLKPKNKEKNMETMIKISEHFREVKERRSK